MATRWERIGTLFAETQTLAAEARAEYLDAHCCDDQALREEVESLLAVSKKTGDYFTDLARRAGLSGLSADAAGRRIGAWRLVQLIGHGGMGAVYLAERADAQFEKLVAIKLVPFAVWGEEARRRFALERRILAHLEHSNIARLLDGGVGENGVPYLVMEYVDGKSIDAYCEGQQLGLRARLELFLVVCDALAYAHRNLVIHRDLKPGNILVTEAGEVKLLDFGIAKLIGPETETAPALTRLGSRPLTPAYASPELLRGETVTTASDVYALGVLLYKLLCGRLPHATSGSSVAEAIRMVCETIPVAPSRAVVDAAAVETTSERLRRRLAGDLDTIVLKALAREPERRYGSVEQLAADIRRHLADEPVSARPDTTAYRMSRFFRRHRIGVAATAALVVLALAAGAVIATYAVRVTRQKDQIARERDKSEKVVQLLTGVFGGADPGIARGKTVTARELLDRGAARIEKELAAQPDLEATMLDQLGVIYYDLSLYTPARTLLEKALALRIRLYGENDMRTEAVMNDLASLNAAMGDYKKAERLDRAALAISRRLIGESNMPVAILLNNLGDTLVQEGKLREGAEYLRAALTLKRRLAGPVDEGVANTLYNLGSVEKKLGNYRAAERFDHEALSMRRKIYGDIHPAIAQSLNALGLVLYYRGKFPEAEKLFRKSLALKKELYKGDSFATVVTLFHIAEVLEARQRLDEARKYARLALAMAKRIWTDPFVEVGIIYRGYGDILTDAGAFRAAHENLQRALDNYARTLPADDYRVADAHVSLGRLYAAEGEYRQSREQFERALAIYAVSLPRGHWKAARARSELGDCLRAEKKYVEAEPLLNQGYRTLLAKLGARHPQTQAASRRLLRLYRDTAGAARYRARVAKPGDAATAGAPAARTAG